MGSGRPKSFLIRTTEADPPDSEIRTLGIYTFCDFELEMRMAMCEPLESDATRIVFSLQLPPVLRVHSDRLIDLHFTQRERANDNPLA